MGSLPPFMLEFSSRLKTVSQDWNSHDWGLLKREMINCSIASKLRVKKAKIVHFSGANKPWDIVKTDPFCAAEVTRMILYYFLFIYFYDCSFFLFRTFSSLKCPCAVYWMHKITLGNFSSTALAHNLELLRADTKANDFTCATAHPHFELLSANGRLCADIARKYF